MKQAGGSAGPSHAGTGQVGHGRTLGELAALAGCEVSGDPGLIVTGVADPAQAGPGDMVFVVEAKYRERALGSLAGFVLASEAFAQRPGLVAKHPRVAMARVMAAFVAPGPSPGIHPGAHVDPQAVLGPQVSVGPGAVIGAGVSVGQGTVLHANVVLCAGARIGSECVLHAGVVVRERCVLGDRVVVQPGAVIGSDGFGFVPTAAGNLKIPQLGDVIVEDDVEIGANCTIDRGTMGDTVIRRGTKLDNLVHIAHNVEVGENCMLVAQVGISGSTKIGERCIFGGQSGAVGHVTIGPRTTLAAKSGITKDTEGNQTLSGWPARPHRDELKRMAEVARMARRMEKLEARLAALAGDDTGNDKAAGDPGGESGGASQQPGEVG